MLIYILKGEITMKLSHFFNLVCVALIAGHIGARIQKKKDLYEAEAAMNEVVETFKKEFPKRRNKGIQPEYIFRSRMEAGETLDAMFAIINEYGFVTIADVRDLIGEQSTFRDNQFGWTDLKEVSIKRTRDGYLLDLPAASLLH